MPKKIASITSLLNYLLIFLTLFLSSCISLKHDSAFDYALKDDSLVVRSATKSFKLTALPGDAIEVYYFKPGEKEFPSFAKKENINVIAPQVKENQDNLMFSNGKLVARVNKQDASISFFRDGKLLVKQKKYAIDEKQRSFSFTLDDSEKIMGGGERVLGMNRRGHRMPLYNRAHYGYTTESNQMYFSLPVIMSNKKYAVLFDNSASGFLDIAKTEKNTLSFEAVSGRSAYIVFSGETYPELINAYVDVTGKQPLPPRWALGNYASRFGYKTEQQVRETVDKFIEANIPLDTIILDLYWFGPDIKGHLGNFDWDKNSFPEPQKMIQDLKQKGIKTILITEPFVLTTSSHWEQAVDKKVLAKNSQGEVERFDFYFGNTGLIDVFDENAQAWFWDIYRRLFQQGVAGTWGDLGEPEVHPDSSIHYFSDMKENVRGDAVHNAYGHQWAKLVYQNQLKLQPEKRPFIMMRSGFAGSQRFGMIPWTGDVSRSWDGLKPQVELSLQMGLFGLAYTHSDLGGFAGGEVFDKEMYIRWLQYGVFQPVYRPHAQDNIAPEPVFHDQQTQDILREYIQLRYQLLPYLYTMVYQNATTGMPLMRPLFFEDESNSDLIDIKDSYLWGDNLLVSPVTAAGKSSQQVFLPQGVWFDFWNDNRYQGNQTVDIPLTIERLPVLVKAGAFVPMGETINNTEKYSTEKLFLHYYADSSIKQSQGLLYDDDGESFASIENEQFELLQFKSKHHEQQLEIHLARKGQGYIGMPEARHVELIIHNWKKPPEKIKINQQDGVLSSEDYFYNKEKQQLIVNINWQHKNTKVVIQ